MFLVRQDAGSRCAQTSPTASWSGGQGCLRSAGPAQSDICPDTRKVLQCRAPWLFLPTGRSCHGRGKKALS